MKISKFGYPFLALFLGFGILFVSLSRTGMEIAAQENVEVQVRNSPIEFVIANNDGTTEPVTYKIPEVKTLPSSPFYGFKKIRDYLWLVFSQGNLNKSKVALLLADKKIAEVRGLIKDDRSKLALEASSEAIDKLKYADQSISKVDAVDEAAQVIDVKNSIYHAGLAYKEVITTMGSQFEIDQTKYQTIINDLDQFNEQKRQEKEDRENQ